MGGQKPVRFVVALLNDAAHFGVDQLGRGLAVRLTLEARRKSFILGRHEAKRSQLVAHPPTQDHLASNLGHLLKIVLGTGRYQAIDQLLSRPTAERARDARP